MARQKLIQRFVPEGSKNLIRGRRLLPITPTYSPNFNNTFQEEFIEFIARKREIALIEARRLVANAQSQFIGGWKGNDYRRFTEEALETFRPLYDDKTDSQVIGTYKFHGAADFLRMLGYVVPKRAELDPIIRRLFSKRAVTIVDYGCGLAHRTIAVSRYLLAQKVKVKLTLIDIRREHHIEFLNFLCSKYQIDYEFVEVNEQRLYPELPEHDYCDIVSVLEHVREPVTVLNNMDRRLSSGGLLLASVEDEIQEMMHISPNLQLVRERLAELKYRYLDRCSGVTLFQKP